MSIKMIKIGWDASIVIMKWYLGGSLWRNSPSRKLFGSWSAITLSYHLSIWIYTKRNFQIFSMNFRCKLCTLNCVDKIYLDTTSPLIFYFKKTGCTEMPRGVKGVSEAINSLVENIFWWNNGWQPGIEVSCRRRQPGPRFIDAALYMRVNTNAGGNRVTKTYVWNLSCSWSLFKRSIVSSGRSSSVYPGMLYTQQVSKVLKRPNRCYTLLLSLVLNINWISNHVACLLALSTSSPSPCVAFVCPERPLAGGSLSSQPLWFLHSPQNFQCHNSDKKQYQFDLGNLLTSWHLMWG